MEFLSHLKNDSFKLNNALKSLLVLGFMSNSYTINAAEVSHPIIDVTYATAAIVIDGKANDKDWQKAQWLPLNKHILGVMPAAADFSGQYKLLWRGNTLYLLAEIVDDVLFDQTADPTVLYWDDDCLELFIDEDASGGEHQFNHNAFAYHVALDTQVADYSTAQKAATYNDHVQTKWRRDDAQPNKIYWEMAVTIYPDSYNDSLSATDKNQAKPVLLQPNKMMGFMLAYCDNDGSKERENFIGSHDIAAVDGDKNRGFKDADVFGKIRLVK